MQFARQGIRVNALRPGPVNTLQELFARTRNGPLATWVHVPLGRFAEPDEIAAAVAFLNDDASFITASTFLVDGGDPQPRPVSLRCDRAPSVNCATG